MDRALTKKTTTKQSETWKKINKTNKTQSTGAYRDAEHA